ncbi:hypothetical protein DFH07DRAFT_769673 [Mycena maculata]|uniref:Uncharacterized protein n=1 Tax=Mycena maculata TaxID=230809 RepID=A0AAD7JNC5_9AGAR|nr:hypothetical protein DFH07DRAFT_769673 [Mycena maculata]
MLNSDNLEVHHSNGWLTSQSSTQALTIDSSVCTIWTATKFPIPSQGSGIKIIAELSVYLLYSSCEDGMKEKAEDILGRKEHDSADEESWCPSADVITPCACAFWDCGMGREINGREGAARCGCNKWKYEPHETEIHDVVVHGVKGLSARQNDQDVEDPEGTTSRMDILRCPNTAYFVPKYECTALSESKNHVDFGFGLQWAREGRDLEAHCAAYQESDSGLQLRTKKVSCKCVGVYRHWGSMSWLWQLECWLGKWNFAEGASGQAGKDSEGA